MIKSAVVIGAGTMGRSIAQFLIQANVNVLLIDENVNALRDAKSNIVNQFKTTDVNNFLQVASGLPKELLVDIVIEAIPEKLTWKQDLFSKLEGCCKRETIFASNTSGLSITEIGRHLAYPERLIGTHFFTPASIIPLVEVVKGKKTSDETSNMMMEFLKRLGKKPVLVKKEIPGFIGNRIQHAINREVLSLLESDVASVEDIDTVMKWSIGIRMALTGPLEQRDVNGLDIHYDIASYLYKDLNNETSPSKLLKDKVAKGETGLKVGKGFYDWHDIDRNEYEDEKNRQLIELIQMINTRETRGN